MDSIRISGNLDASRMVSFPKRFRSSPPPHTDNDFCCNYFSLSVHFVNFNFIPSGNFSNIGILKTAFNAFLTELVELRSFNDIDRFSINLKIKCLLIYIIFMNLLRTNQDVSLTSERAKEQLGLNEYVFFEKPNPQFLQSSFVHLETQ